MPPIAVGRDGQFPHDREGPIRPRRHLAGRAAAALLAWPPRAGAVEQMCRLAMAVEQQFGSLDGGEISCTAIAVLHIVPAQDRVVERVVTVGVNT